MNTLVRHVLLAFMGFALAPHSAQAQDADSLHYAEVYLNSLYKVARVQAPRLQLSALHTFIAHPSLLERWHVINSDAAASYNDWTNTLILQIEMTKYDEIAKRVRVRSLAEMHESVGASAQVSAAIVFHEMSHAEWDVYAKDGDETFDRDLIAAFELELPAIIKANGISKFASLSLASEVFAYYREELIATILSDAAEIRRASGIEPDTNACAPLRKRVDVLRDFSPKPEPYATRVQLTMVWISGQDVNLNLDANANRRLNAALYAHAKATLSFPASREELFNRLSKDRAVREALVSCREH